MRAALYVLRSRTPDRMYAHQPLALGLRYIEPPLTFDIQHGLMRSVLDSAPTPSHTIGYCNRGYVSPFTAKQTLPPCSFSACQLFKTKQQSCWLFYSAEHATILFRHRMRILRAPTFEAQRQTWQRPLDRPQSNFAPPSYSSSALLSPQPIQGSTRFQLPSSITS